MNTCSPSALHPTARRLDVARVQVTEVDLALRGLGRLVGLGRAVSAQPPPILHPAVAAVVLVGGVGVELDLVVFLQPALSLLEPLGPRPGDRARLPRAALIQAPARVAQPALAALRRRQRLGQLVTARLPEALVLLGVDGVGVLEDLARDLL